ncbi:MAG TPA: zinc ribbon domain-containing protein [Terriglobales bacterium]|nr:zinc ribbon domain-containing protein [Terriglobales bacterium]
MAFLRERVVCSKCSTNLPGDSAFCPKCGEKVVAEARPEPPSPNGDLRCAHCGAALPEGSRFCLKCGARIAVVPLGEPEFPLRQPRGKVRLTGWFLLPALALAVWWLASTDNSVTAGFQRAFHRAHEETVVPATFSVGARSFAYFKFTVPASVGQIAVSGNFSAQGDGKDKEKDKDNAVEVQLLTEDGFISWQDGYSATSYYTSGRVTQGEINALLPNTADTYVFVFSNKFSPKAAKTVQSAITLQYERRWPVY